MLNWCLNKIFNRFQIRTKIQIKFKILSKVSKNYEILSENLRKVTEF